MPLTTNFHYNPDDIWPKMWHLLAEDTVVWRPPTPDERAELRRTRAQIYQQSHIPWIVSDIGSLLQFWDDIQDIVSFTRWNKRILSPKRLKKCLTSPALSKYSGAARFWKCFCGARPKPRKRRALSLATGAGIPVWGLTALLARLFPGTAPLMWLLLAGQVSYSLFGVGIKLGPAIGLGIEAFYRGLDAVGLPFGPEHNKYHQLQRARALEKAHKAYGTWPLLGQSHGILGLIGTWLALSRTTEPIVINPDALPSLTELLHDPWGSLIASAEIASITLHNLNPGTWLPYIHSSVDHAARLTGNPSPGIPEVPTNAMAQAIRRINANERPSCGACDEALAHYLRTLDWLGPRFVERHLNPFRNITDIVAKELQ